jgi:hypothetical protein
MYDGIRATWFFTGMACQQERNIRIKRCSMNTEALLNEMMSFADVLREMDIEFIVAGEYGITVEEAVKLINKDHFLFLDVRTREERAHLAFPFALHIPVNEIPDRIGEVARDKCIITF